MTATTNVVAQDSGTTVVAEPAPTDGRSTRMALWVFVGILAVAGPVVLFRLGSYHWFFGDDFSFLSGREAGSVRDLFEPYNAHWTTLPVLEFRALYEIFGMRSYMPYQACVLALHLSACALLRAIMRRVGVDPWIATVAAGSFVFFGPGYQNILWAFQIGFTGSLTFGLTQLVLGDHDGPFDRRDALGVFAGLLALMSSGVGIAMAVIAGLAMLGRRGPKVALLHASPLAAAYIVWWLVERPELSTPLGRPSASDLLRWLRSGEIGVFTALGHFQLVAALLAIVLVVGLVLAWARLPLAELRRRASLPAAMFIGGIVFSAFTAMGRWYNGADFARSSRYVHIGAALTLPAIAVALDGVARRWRFLTVPLVLMLLVAVPANVDAFHGKTFGPSYMAARKEVITNIVRLPEAHQVPRELRPIPDRFSPTVTVGWLLATQGAGKLRPETSPLEPPLENELRVRLGVDQRARGVAVDCRTVKGELDVSPAAGTVIGISKPLTVATHEGAKTTSSPIPFSPVDGQNLTIRLGGLDLRLASATPNGSFTMCDVATPDELLQRLLRAVVVQSAGGPMHECRQIRSSIHISLRKGAMVGFEGAIVISAPDGDRPSPGVVFRASDGNVLAVRIDKARLRLAPRPRFGSFMLCSVG